MTASVKYGFWMVMALLAVFLFATTAEYLSFRTDINFLLVKKELIFDTIWGPTFYLHVISGMMVILIGPFQFLELFRKKYLSFHRKVGKFYAYAILFVAAPTGLIMAFYAEGGYWSTLAFIMMSMAWFYTTLKAVITIKKKDIIAHKKWMMRSYALSFAAVTLRLLMPLLSLSITDNHRLLIISTAWLSWLLNLTVVEGMIIATEKQIKKAPKITN